MGYYDPSPRLVRSAGQGTLYSTLDRHDNKQYRELWATPAAVDAARKGEPVASGTVLTLVQYKAQLDAAGVPAKDAQGRFIKGDLVAYTVMEKRAGWGAEYRPQGFSHTRRPEGQDY